MVLKRKQYRRGALKDLQDMQQGRKRLKYFRQLVNDLWFEQLKAEEVV
jgi:hypothetical protein